MSVGSRKKSTETDGNSPILVVGSGTRFVSGLTYYTADLANSLAASHKVLVILMRRLLPRKLYPGAKRVGAPLSEVTYDSSIRIFDGIDWYWIPSMLRALTFVKQNPPKWVLFQWWSGTVVHSYVLLALVTRLLGARVIIEFHEVLDTAEERVPLARQYVGILGRLLVNLADGFVVHSTEDIAELERRYNVREKPIRLVPHGPYTSRLAQANESTLRDPPEDVCNLLFFGTIRPFKGLEHAVSAFDSLSSKEADRYWLTVVGETWEGWTLPAKLIERSRYRSRITFVNHYVHDSEAAAFFRGADAVVLPYLRSSASGPLHMAMSAGLPVIVSGVGGLIAATEGYEGAVLVPPSDPTAIREAFGQVADMKDQRFEDRHSWSHTVDELEQLFREIESHSGGESYLVKRVKPIPTVSVVICAYDRQRWDGLRAATESVSRQTQSAVETIVVIDHNPELLGLAKAGLNGARVLESEGNPGISAARNTGLKQVHGEVVAFLDDDAVADETWLEKLASPYTDPDVIGVGGVARPRWADGKAPRWLPREFYWTVGCEYRGLPTQTMPIRNPIGTTMSFRKTVFDRVGGFSSAIGRVGNTPLGGDETELSIRARQVYPAGVVLHMPAACVEHFVSSQRSRWSYFRSRCWLEGRSKALMAQQVGAPDALSEEWTYTLKTLPRGVLRGFWDAARRDPAGLQRSGAIIAGLAITAAGYLLARVTPQR